MIERRPLLALSFGWVLFVLQSAACAPAADPISPAITSPIIEPSIAQAATVVPSPLPPPDESNTPLDVPAEVPSPVMTDSSGLITRPGEPIARLAPGTRLVLESIWMMDAATGWAAGGVNDDRAHILTTSDGGETWRDVTPPEPVTENTSILAVTAFFLDADTGWAAFQRAPTAEGFLAPIVWRTTDRGETWVQGEPLDVSGFMGFYGPSRIGFSDREHGWILLDLDSAMMHRYVAIYATEDAGLHWTRVVDPDSDAPIQTGDKTGLVLGSAGIGLLTRDLHGLVEGVSVEITRDGGATWESISLTLPENVAVSQLCWSHSPVVFSETTLAVGVSCREWNESGSGEDNWLDGAAYIFLTYDGGENWERVDAPGGILMYLPGDVVLSLGRDIHRSEDGGRSWRFVKHVSWDANFTFVSVQLGWAAARAEDEHALVQTLDGGRTWIALEPCISQE